MCLLSHCWPEVEAIEKMQRKTYFRRGVEAGSKGERGAR